ncbi:MAG TPA: zinc ABC transporter substrate-binding protein [Acidimicrobiia bacterium]|nr:zinc ABC transporter substrate-binding protein [Acidimicrobiia bacterium]
MGRRVSLVSRLALVAGLLLATTPLAATAAAAAPAPAAATTKKQKVVASFYPLAFAAERVGGGRVTVRNLTPAGAEPHDLELTPDQIDEVLDADLVLVLGRNFQPAVEKAAQERDGLTVRLLDVLPLNAGSKKVAEGNPSALDPHVWLDPVLMSDIVTRVQKALTKVDPRGASTYRANADALRTELAAVDGRYRRGLATCARNLVVTSHEAFGYLARRYGLRQEGVAGLSPDAEPDPERLAELTDLAKREHVTVIFTEELVSPRIAQTLAREVGVRTDTLNPLEGLTPAEQRAGANYFSVMDTNLQKLRRALGCT